MAFGESKGEAAALFEGVLKRVRMVRPEEAVAGEGVVEGVVGREREGWWGGWRGRGGGEDEARRRGGRVEEEVVEEVEVDVAVEVVGVDGGRGEEFRDFEVGVRGESVLEGLPEGVEKGEELGGEDVL